MSTADIAKSRLADPDSQAHHLQALLQSVEPLPGNMIHDDAFKGLQLLQDRVKALAVEGDNTAGKLTATESISVLRFLASVNPRKGVESYADGGAAECGHHMVLWWIADQLEGSGSDLSREEVQDRADECASTVWDAQAVVRSVMQIVDPDTGPDTLENKDRHMAWRALSLAERTLAAAGDSTADVIRPA